MKKVHLCCGTVYLTGYENCDHDGIVLDDLNKAMINNQIIENPNETTIDNYFKFPFEPDASKRVHRDFIIDTKMNILEKWYWEDKSVDEIVMINGWEHFTHNKDIPIIYSEIKRVLKTGGVFKFDFPDMKAIVNKYHDNANDPEYCACLLYCNHKNPYSIHHWGYTKNSIKLYFPESEWVLEFKDVVKHDYPSQGVWAIKK